MPFVTTAGIRYFTFESLSAHGIVHAVFTRHGGVSASPWDGLNVGGTVGDDPACVMENRQRAFRALSRPPESIFDVWQVHGNAVVQAQAPRPADVAHQQADAIVTDRSAVTLFMRFADCVPILLYDPQTKVVGIAHAGWQGTVKQTAAQAVLAMAEQYGSRAADVLAAIGPSIGPDHYEVGQDVIRQVEAAFGSASENILQYHSPSQDKAYLDLWQANRLVLEAAGVTQIEVAGICTACQLDDWYSHRAEKGRTGRFGALIALGNGSHTT